MPHPQPHIPSGLIIVDHGSTRSQSNDLLTLVAKQYQQYAGWKIVEPAHMELAEPSIAAAFQRCVEQGAKLVVVFPFFLGPGRHWTEDIPRLTAQAAEPFVDQGVSYIVTAPLGVSFMMPTIIDDTIRQCLGRADGWIDAYCLACRDIGGCQFIPKLAPPAQ